VARARILHVRLLSLAGVVAIGMPMVAPQQRPQAPAVPDIAAAVAGMQQRYAAVDSVTAGFEQTYRAPGVLQTESGILYMKKPGLMRWEYREPAGKLFVADGRETYLYVPEDRQVFVRRLSADESRSTPLQFLLGHGRITESFDVFPEREAPSPPAGTLQMRLIPRAPDPAYEHLVLEMDERTWDIRRLVIREHTGHTSEFRLTDLRTNARLDNRFFRFKIPKGVEVIRLEEK